MASIHHSYDLWSKDTPRYQLRSNANRAKKIAAIGTLPTVQEYVVLFCFGFDLFVFCSFRKKFSFSLVPRSGISEVQNIKHKTSNKLKTSSERFCVVCVDNTVSFMGAFFFFFEF